MNEQDEKMLQQFFSSAAGQQIADNGFTEQVMQHLPQRRSWLERLWTPFCIATFAVLFIVFDGWTLLVDRALEIFHALLHTSIRFSVTTMAAILFSLLFVGLGEVVVYERRLL